MKTGSCDCGVLGEKCTLCPPGHIIEGGQCVKCDSCVQNTLKRVNVLIKNITVFKDIILPSGSIDLSTIDGVNKTLRRYVLYRSKKVGLKMSDFFLVKLKNIGPNRNSV